MGEDLRAVVYDRNVVKPNNLILSYLISLRRSLRGEIDDKPPNGWAPRSPSFFRACFRLESEPTFFIQH